MTLIRKIKNPLFVDDGGYRDDEYIEERVNIQGRFAPGTPVEDDDSIRQNTESSAELYVRGKINVSSRDQIMIKNIIWSVAGEPARWMRGTVIRLERSS